MKKEDVGFGSKATIQSVEEVDVAMEGDPSEVKPVIWFQEFEKPLIANVTNLKLIAAVVGSEETDTWPGKVVELYNDPLIMYGGKITGGVRVRQSGGGRQQPQQMQRPNPQRPQQSQQRPQQGGLQRPPVSQAPSQPSQQVPADDDDVPMSDNDGAL